MPTRPTIASTLPAGRDRGTVARVSSSDRPRLVALETVFNFRDLGGYPTADGRLTRWRTLYRADGLGRLAGADLEAVRELGLRTVIDLRTATEIDERGRFPVDEHPVEYHHIPILDVIWEPEDAPTETVAADFLLHLYLQMIEGAEARIVQTFQILASPDALPAVFHCAAGKDRTGVVAALVLSSLGVADEVVVADYALTGSALGRLRAWAERERPSLAEAIARQPAVYLAADPDAMAGLLRTLAAQHGSVRGFVERLGVTADVLAALEDALLEPLSARG
jgi:protein-tyrosine phosphatase